MAYYPTSGSDMQRIDVTPQWKLNACPKHGLISICTVLTSSKRSKPPPVQEECGSTEVDTVDGTDKRRYPPNWLAEIEVPLGMKYVLSSHISKYRRLFWTGNRAFNYSLMMLVSSVFFIVGLYHSINVISNNAKRFFEYPVNIRRAAPGKTHQTVINSPHCWFSPFHISRYHSVSQLNAFETENSEQIPVFDGRLAILLWSSEPAWSWI